MRKGPNMQEGRHFCTKGHFCTRVKEKINIMKKERKKSYRPMVRARSNSISKNNNDKITNISY